MSSGFITESEAAEVRKRRQAEWEKVRKPDDPLERPEEVHDHRSLYERLQEQKQKKDLDYEEAHKLKNMIKGLDDDEIEFLDLIDRTKLAADRKKNIEEELELTDYRNRVASLQEKTLDTKLQAEIQSIKPKVTASTKTNSQTKLLKGVVVVKRTEAAKRKRSESEEPESSHTETSEKPQKTSEKPQKTSEKPQKTSEKPQESSEKPQETSEKRQKTSEKPQKTSEKPQETSEKPRETSEKPQEISEKPLETSSEDEPRKRSHESVETLPNANRLRCIGILPGLGCYNDSSSNGSSEDSDREDYGLLESECSLIARKVTVKEKKAGKPEN